jgi:hypothetical protein
MDGARSKLRYLHLTPDRLIVGLLVVVALLWLSGRFQWFPFNHHKGWTVLIAVASIGAAILAMVLWLIGGLLFRWRFQFSIRSLLVLTVAVAISCGWLAVEMKRAREQRAAVEAIKRTGLEVDYDFQWEIPDYWKTGYQPGPALARNLFGVDFLAEVVAVRTGGGFFGGIGGIVPYTLCKATDQDLLPLKAFKRLRFLYLAATEIGDSWMECLDELHELQDLSVWYTDVGDKGMEHLRGLTNLRELGIEHTKVTNSGLVHLKDLPNLEKIRLAKTTINDNGLLLLAQRKRLKELDFMVPHSAHQFSREGVARFRRALPGCKVVE